MYFYVAHGGISMGIIFLTRIQQRTKNRTPLRRQTEARVEIFSGILKYTFVYFLGPYVAL